jgi:hypothetical protein
MTAPVTASPTPFRAAFIARARAAHRRIALESAEKARRACVVPAPVTRK